MIQKQKKHFGFFIFLVFVVIAIIAYQPKASAPVLTDKGNTYAPNSLKTLHDGTYDRISDTSTIYQLQYPRDFELFELDQARGGFLGAPRFTLAFPEDSFTTPKSNFSEAYLTVRIGIDADAIKNCFVAPAETSKSFTAGPTIHGILFEMTTATDVAAGNIYDSRIYRTLQDKRCYEITETVHTGNIRNYDPGAVVEFDKEKAYSELEKILQTFTLTTKEGPVD